MKKQRLFYDEPGVVGETYHAEEGWTKSLFDNLGSAFNGIASIVNAANTKTENINEHRDITSTNKNSFTWTNGTTVAAVVMGGVVICVILALTLKNK